MWSFRPDITTNWFLDSAVSCRLIPIFLSGKRYRCVSSFVSYKNQTLNLATQNIPNNPSEFLFLPWVQNYIRTVPIKQNLKNCKTYFSLQKNICLPQMKLFIQQSYHYYYIKLQFLVNYVANNWQNWTLSWKNVSLNYCFNWIWIITVNGCKF